MQATLEQTRNLERIYIGGYADSFLDRALHTQGRKVTKIPLRLCAFALSYFQTSYRAPTGRHKA